MRRRECAEKLFLRHRPRWPRRGRGRTGLEYPRMTLALVVHMRFDEAGETLDARVKVDMFLEILALANASTCVAAAMLCGLSPSSCSYALPVAFRTLTATLVVDTVHLVYYAHPHLWTYLAHHAFFLLLLQLPVDPRLNWYYCVILLQEASTIALSIMALEKELRGEASAATRAWFAGLFLVTRVILFWYMFLVSLGDISPLLSLAALAPGALNLHWLRCIHTKSGTSLPFGWLCAASFGVSVALYIGTP